MNVDRHDLAKILPWLWGSLYAILALYVAARMGAFALEVTVPGPSGFVAVPNTFASVDHPFHVARAETLWREISSGELPRWIGQHQGGYPVEFYPLGEAWLEVALRALSLGSLSAPGAHTLAIVLLFLVPGVAFAALANIDGWSPAVALNALILHMSLPGSWYHGGYTELVQWGLVTNVAAATASLLLLPVMVRFLAGGRPWTGAASAALAAFAIYCNPRSLIGLAALGGGALLAIAIQRRWRSVGPAAPAADRPAGGVAFRSAQLLILAALLAAPELVALARFGDLYTFVRYSGYDDISAYVAAASASVTWPGVIAALAGLAYGLTVRGKTATTSLAFALPLYALATVTIAFVPAASRLAPQLEPTRLMPLQRFLTIYLAAVAIWAVWAWMLCRAKVSGPWVAPATATAFAVVFLLIQTRPVAVPLDPASPVVPAVSLYPVSMSAQPQQAELEAAVRAADEAALPGTALLIVGSALSWHQQLWAPFWTERPLFYDNWLWYWHPDHAGTPRYDFLAGHHYPDPEMTLHSSFLTRHGIGAVVATGPVRDSAATSPLLRPLRRGQYDAFAVIDPVTTVTFAGRDAAVTSFGNQQIEAESDAPAASIAARLNWHPRWSANAGGSRAEVVRGEDGYLVIHPRDAATDVELRYALRPIDWAARFLALLGFAGLCWLTIGGDRRGRSETAAERTRV